MYKFIVSVLIQGFFLLSSVKEAVLGPAEYGVTLTSNLSPVPLTSSGQEIVFTCTTQGSGILEWISQQYIGDHRIIQILSLSSAPDTVVSSMNPNTTARRIRVTTDHSRGTEIVSELRIIALSQYPMGSVTCRNGDFGTTRTIMFQVSDDVTLNSSVSENENMVSDREVVIFTCTTQGSGILEWISQQYIGDNEIQILSLSIAPDTVVSSMNPNTTARRIRVTVNSLGVTEIVSQLQIIALSQYPMGSVTCRNGDFGTTMTIMFQVSDQVSPTSNVTQVDSTSTHDSTTIEITDSQPGSDQAIIGVITAMIFIGLVVVVVLTLVYVVICFKGGFRERTMPAKVLKTHTSVNLSVSACAEHEGELECLKQQTSLSDQYVPIETPMNASLVADDEASSFFGKDISELEYKNSRVSADSGHPDEEPQEESKYLDVEPQEESTCLDVKPQEESTYFDVEPQEESRNLEEEDLEEVVSKPHIRMRPNEKITLDCTAVSQEETTPPEEKGPVALVFVQPSTELSLVEKEVPEMYRSSSAGTSRQSTPQQVRRSSSFTDRNQMDCGPPKITSWSNNKNSTPVPLSVC